VHIHGACSLLSALCSLLSALCCCFIISLYYLIVQQYLASLEHGDDGPSLTHMDYKAWQLVATVPSEVTFPAARRALEACHGNADAAFAALLD
jgi:hypothetical protein